jgi:hypothetical protein
MGARPKSRAGKETNDRYNRLHMLRLTAVLLVVPSVALLAQQPPRERPSKEQIIARAKALELSTPYVPPPGDPLVHHAAGYAKILCSAVFVSGHDLQFAAENLGYFVAPLAERHKLGAPALDRKKKEVYVDVPSAKTRRTARYLGDLGCVTLPTGDGKLHFTPKSLPKVAEQPFGNSDPPSPKVAEAIDAAFADPAGMTAAFVVTWKGRIIGERYAAGIDKDTPLESWSMGKSLIATLMGVLLGADSRVERHSERSAEGDPDCGPAPNVQRIAASRASGSGLRTQWVSRPPISVHRQ